VTAAAATVARREATLRRLELLVTRKLDGLLQGDHQGLVPGAGTDPGESRPYRPGDDVRRMDWSLTARAAEPYVRDTVADRELETWLVVDGSASMDFGTAACEKRDLAVAAVAAFGFLTARSGNRVGAVLFGPAGAVVVAPRGGREAVFALLRRVDGRERAPAGPASLDVALRRTRLVARRRGLVVVVGDLLGERGWERELRAVAARHDLVVAEVRDPREAELPPVGLLTLVDPETGRRVEAQTASARLRARFAEGASAERAATAAAVRAAGAAHLVLSTDRDWLRDVVAFAAARRRRR
jgi:uncharacterized protein (DUF58 family)